MVTTPKILALTHLQKTMFYENSMCFNLVFEFKLKIWRMWPAGSLGALSEIIFSLVCMIAPSTLLPGRLTIFILLVNSMMLICGVPCASLSLTQTYFSDSRVVTPNLKQLASIPKLVRLAN